MCALCVVMKWRVDLLVLIDFSHADVTAWLIWYHLLQLCCYHSHFGVLLGLRSNFQISTEIMFFFTLFASQISRSVVFLLACFSLLQIACGSLKLHLPLSILLNTVGFLKTVLQCRCGWSEFVSSCLVIYTSTLARGQLWDNKWPQINRIFKCFTT